MGRKFKVGDKVKVVKDKLIDEEHHKIPIGTLTEVISVDKWVEEGAPYRVNASDLAWLAEDELEFAE